MNQIQKIVVYGLKGGLSGTSFGLVVGTIGTKFCDGRSSRSMDVERKLDQRTILRHAILSGSVGTLTGIGMASPMAAAVVGITGSLVINGPW